MDDQRANREGGGVKLFWIAVCSVIIATFIALYATNRGPYRGGPLQPWHKPVRYISTGLLVAVVWAILFRSQVASLRISLSAMFVLILLEATYLFAIRFANPFWAFGQ
jgi:hypothetical protein